MSYDFSESELDALEAWKERGQLPTGFLWYVINNDLIGAVAYANTPQENFFADCIMSINLRLPRECWGSPEKVAAWHRKFNHSIGEDDGHTD